MKRFVLAISSGVLALGFSQAGAASLAHVSTFNLSADLERSNTNFNPVGLGYDESANELLIAQQGSRTLYRTDLSGNVVGSFALPNVTGSSGNTSTFQTNLNHTTSVAGDANGYYITDYTCNAACSDLYRIEKDGSTGAAISSEVAAYGGYPIDVRDGMLYRTEVSTTYSWSNLTTIRVSDVTDADNTLSTVTLATAGIGDIAVDSARNEIYVLEWGATANINRFDLTDGSLLDTFALGVDGLTSGLTFADDRLYFYDWAAGNSTLSVYDVNGLPSVAPVPLPAGALLMFTAMGGLGLMRRRKAAA